MIRIDIILTEQGLAKSRAQAQSFINEGRVSYKQDQKWLNAKKPSLKIDSNCELKIEKTEADKYVSRGALKLEGALQHTKLDITGFQVLDVGQSTGGFTDCALQHGAANVIGIEVGHDQLDSRLRKHPNVTCLEGINARNLTIADLNDHFPEQGFDLVVMDVSFISQTKILPQLPALLAKQGHLITLVKPQFEVGKDFIGKGGIVKDVQRITQLAQEMQDFVQKLGFKTQCYIESPIKGGDGNQEFLLWAIRDAK
ncbi:TlyA family RNA methyltransferase [Marinomonas transparens]|uniref:TlyA family RNA methyltransferase n=1 Tax=Marinomonas transparens TaxID=2795388 RepID=A0A934JPM9_9GAMM|nr:TlyA family RNA methyltransferase [Marinomonas transparens]MBJ7538348.1 TlyA family RNA methyltransferase [Marinomonas transparens]